MKPRHWGRTSLQHRPPTNAPTYVVVHANTKHPSACPWYPGDSWSPVDTTTSATKCIYNLMRHPSSHSLHYLKCAEAPTRGHNTETLQLFSMVDTVRMSVLSVVEVVLTRGLHGSAHSRGVSVMTRSMIPALIFIITSSLHVLPRRANMGAPRSPGIELE